MVAEVNSIFTASGMERDPFSNTSDFTSSLKRSQQRLPDHLEMACDELIDRLAHEVRVRGLEVRQPFIDYFKNPNSPKLIDQVTNEQFKGGLTQLGLSCDARELDLLRTRFAGEPGFVNFNEFSCAVDPALKTFSAREPRSDLFEGYTLKNGFRAPVVLESGLGQPGRPPSASDWPRLPQDPPSAELGELLQRFQDKALQYRIRVGEAFKDFDKHRNGTVTQPQFSQGLHTTFGHLRLAVSEREHAMLVERYGKRMPHGAIHVDWRAFTADVEAVFTGGASRLERNPIEKPGQRYLERQPVTLPPAEEEAVQALLRDMRRRVEARRALVKPMFADYEKQVNSAKAVDHVTRSQMVQAFSRLGIDLPFEQQRLLFHRYDTHGNGLVNYVALVRDIDAYESFSTRKNTHHVFPQDADYGKYSTGIPAGGFIQPRVLASSPQPGRPVPRNDAPGAKPTAGLDELLTRLSGAVHTHRLKTDQAFHEFDRGRHNQVTQPQFIKVLNMIFGKFVPLTEDDQMLLLDAFATPLKGVGTGVAWRDFVEAVDSTPPPPKGLRLPTLSPQEEEIVAEVCARLAHEARTRRLLIRPFFQDMEKSRRSINRVDHITRMQFAECLSSLGLNVAAAELAVLARKFDDMGDGWVNYVAFQVCIGRPYHGPVFRMVALPAPVYRRPSCDRVPSPRPQHPTGCNRSGPGCIPRTRRAGQSRR